MTIVTVLYNELKVNISKTNIMVFARSKTRLNNIPTATIKFGNIDLEQVEPFVLKLKFRKYPSIHTNYIISHSTILQYNHNYLIR